MKKIIKKWKEEEIQFIIENYSSMTNRELGEKLGRSEGSVECKIRSIIIPEATKLNHKEMIAKRSASYNTEHFSGENNPNYKNGISKNNYHYKKIQIKRYPEKYKARRKVYLAVKKGKLKKLPCEVCGELKVQAHHEDYSKPLEVNWLCRKHHYERDLIKWERDKNLNN